MSPLVAYRLEKARANFDGRIFVVEDRGDSVLVVIVPADWNPFATETDDNDSDWGRVTTPQLMLIDPALACDEGPSQ